MHKKTLIIRRLDRAARNFIWTGDITKKGLVTVSWSRMCAPTEEGGMGLRSLSSMNASFLMRFTWDILATDSLAPRFLRSRFLDGDLEPKVTPVSSSLWTGFRPFISSLKTDSRWIIGDGSAISFWWDNWLGYSIADKLGIPRRFRMILAQKVSDYLFDGTWHLTSLFILNCEDIVMDMLDMPVVGGKDSRIWSKSVHGTVSSRIAYWHIHTNFPIVRWGKWIWHTCIPSRRSLLVWRLIHNKLPLWGHLQSRGTIGPAVCHFCFHHSEDLDHCFLDCPMVRPNWDFFSGLFNVHLDFSSGIWGVIIQSLEAKGSSQILFLWKLTLITLIWVIWTCRNKAIFEDYKISIMAVRAQVFSFIRESRHTPIGYMNNDSLDLSILSKLAIPGYCRRNNYPILVRWSLPPFGWIKVNTDGSAMGSPGDSACGGVFRNCHGFVVGCFTVRLGLGFAFLAELQGAITACEIALDKGWNFIWLESDSSYVVSIFSTFSMQVPWVIKGRLILLFRRLRLVFIGRLIERLTPFLSRRIWLVILGGMRRQIFFRRKLVESPYKESVDWSKWLIFWVDERVVPLDHEDSNYLLASRGFLSKVPIPPSNIYAINDKKSPEGAADDYEDRLKDLVSRKILPISNISGFPKFDFMLLGMGPDGHVASLFPSRHHRYEKERWVTFITDSPKPPPPRITFTFPVINSASEIAMVITGADLADTTKIALGNGQIPGSTPLPCTEVSAEGELTWFLDKDAASKL